MSRLSTHSCCRKNSAYRWLSMGLLLVALSAISANAADNTPPPAAALADKPVMQVTYANKLLSVTAKDAELKDVLMKIGEAVPTKVDVGEGITGRVTLAFKDMPLADGLAALVKGEGKGIVIGFDEQGTVKFIKASRKAGTQREDVVSVRKVRDYFPPEYVARSLTLKQSRELVRDLQDESKRKEWGKLADKIMDIKKKEAKPYLRELMNHKVDYIRWEANTAYCALVDIEDADFVLEMATDKDRDRRATVAYIAMPLIDDSRQIPLLMEMMKDPKDSVREGAIKTLGSKKVQEAIPALTDLLKDTDGHLRSLAAESLRAITGQEYEWMTPEEKQLIQDRIRRQEERRKTR